MTFPAPHVLMFALPEGLTGLAGVVLILGIYVFMSWMICVTAAFWRVREVQFGVGLLAMGVSLLGAFLLVGLCRSLMPDVAASFTPGGLFLISAVASALVLSVPLIQYFWSLSYIRGLGIVGGAVALLVSGLVVVHLFLYPVETLPARFSMPLFQDHQPGLVE